MTLDEFVAETMEDVDRFKRDWTAHRDVSPDQWPESMSPGDWFEQFLVFLDT